MLTAIRSIDICSSVRCGIRIISNSLHISSVSRIDNYFSLFSNLMCCNIKSISLSLPFSSPINGSMELRLRRRYIVTHFADIVFNQSSH